MFLLSISINRPISFGGFYLVYFLVFFHSFLTIINASDNDLYEKEEIIQLSLELIHIVKTTESQIPKKIEVNVDDNEENELLLTLLTSYDDKVRINTKQPDDELPIINTHSSIHFIPSALHFNEQPIIIPRMQTVIIINGDSEPLELYSLTGTTNEFYSSVLKQTVLPPYVGNITLNIYYFPRTIGPRGSILTIKTNRGDFSYEVSGIGISNPYRLRSLINIEIPLNSTFEYTIPFHNPYNYPLQINEIYTSDENLIIELENRPIRVTRNSPVYEQWYLKPYETKSIIKMNYLAYQSNQLYAFICIKTNFSERIILPVQINVVTRSGLYSNVDLLEFPIDRFLSSANQSTKTPVYVFNHGVNPVIITDVRVDAEYRHYITVRYKTLPIPPDIHRLNQIADITIHWNLIPKYIQHVHGYVEVYTSMNSNEPMLKIPFDEKVIHGSLDFPTDETYIYISNEKQTEECRSIKLFNRYKLPIAVYNITINNFELLSRYIQIKHSSSYLYLYPNQWTELFCVILLPQSLLSTSFNSIQGVIDIYTNLSHFSLPIHLYDGFLNLDILNDHTNGGIQQNEYDPLELLITSIPVNTTRQMRFILTNSNPIDISMEILNFVISNGDIQLDYVKSLDSDEVITSIKDKKSLSSMVIPQQHQAIFLLTLHGSKPPNSYTDSLTIKTSYQTLHINIKYQIINGSLEFLNKTPLHIDVFPNRLASADVFLQNKFSEPVNITRIDFITYGLCFSFTWNDTSINGVLLQSNQIQRIGRVNFDMAPLCKSILRPSESTCYCGLNHHPELKREWDESISLMNTYELDQVIVKKFRKLWKKWTSLIRKHRIETNVWLYTDRANISWPVTINFIWPSVLERTSSSPNSTPMIIDFQVSFIDTTKIQNVTITNPSSDLLTYSVALLSNDQVFTISTTSKPISSKDNHYNFHLLPDEQITFTVAYRPTSSIKHEVYFVVRNNLTILESILLRGEGGIGGLRVGSSVNPILLEIDENQYNLCSNLNGNPVLQKTLTLENTGNRQTIISDISFGHSKCLGQGFSVPICTDIVIEPYEKYDLQILFQPNYTSDEINETLSLNTTIGLMTFPIVVRIPYRVLSACYRTISRPPWEWKSYVLYLCVLIVCIILVYASATFNAHKLFLDYLIRVEWRNQIQRTNKETFDPDDLSSAIQAEQKPRERADSNEMTDTKKEMKHKRSLNSRVSDVSNTTNRSITVNLKELPQKTRRATTDSGVPKLTKHPSEVLSKPTPVFRRQKSETSSQLISSPPISDDENEPFVFARSKRILSKRKGSISNTSPPAIQKSSFQSHQQDLIQLDDSLNDQQWHMVISNKGHRKGIGSRRETSEESRITNRTPKDSSTDTTKPLTLISSPHTHSSISHHHHHPTHVLSSISVPIQAQRTSFQENIPLITVNRELAFRQLTEQLWAAGLPSSTTTCSMSTHSCYSSAPSSERDGGDEETSKLNYNNGDTRTTNNNWDEPTTPDQDFGQYVSQTEQTMDDLTNTNDGVQAQRKTSIPPLMSLTITPPPAPPVVSTNSLVPTTVTKENIEPLPFHQQRPGPIQRPTKLSCPLIIQSSSFLHNSTRSPDTPEVLVHINHLVDRQNSIATMPSNDSSLTNSSTMTNEVSTPNASWTPFSPPAEWSSKYEPSWPLTAQTQNPFAQRQISTDEANLWSESQLNTSWSKFLPASATNRQENETNNTPFWNLSEASPNSSTSWWPKTSSDENNNDQSRWEFAR